MMTLLQPIHIFLLGASVVMAASVDPKKDVEIPNTCSVIACSTPGNNGLPGRDGRDGKEGPRGEKGDTGLRGLQGPPGKAGPPGMAGSAGPTGPKGDQGAPDLRGDSGSSGIALLKQQLMAVDSQLKALQAAAIKQRKVSVFKYQNRRNVGEKVFVASILEESYEAAKMTCSKAGGLLASPRNAAENAALQELVATIEKSAILGMDDQQTEGTFKHIGGDKVTYSNWSRNEPNNDKGHEHCVHMLTNGKWNDMPCVYSGFGICEF